ncbi:MAG: hypothetical protein M4579_004696 [Chaenotheca gracillima]|nr:MAG: hypothetical protein M4579_004696 [Chaenotheca gracillima]
MDPRTPSPSVAGVFNRPRPRHTASSLLACFVEGRPARLSRTPSSSAPPSAVSPKQGAFGLGSSPQHVREASANSSTMSAAGAESVSSSKMAPPPSVVPKPAPRKVIYIDSSEDEDIEEHAPTVKQEDGGNKKARTQVNLEDSDELAEGSELFLEDGKERRRSQRSSVLSKKATDNRIVWKNRRSKKNTGRGQGSANNSAQAPAGVDAALTSRQSVRLAIATETAPKRATFYRVKKDLFVPLLPERNHIQKLLEQEQDSVSPVDEDIVPYEAFESQPEGIKATLKPYQLAGLSFLVFLHKNGLSGILGDEMGLGKTLQTLSLFQYLKNSTPPKRSGEQARPCLVVCPLSVLSSWMEEARKWTPGLKVLRFHGPANERDRIKKVAEGKEDRFGNKAPPKSLKRKRGAQPAPAIISLDSDSDGEMGSTSTPDVVITTYDTFKAEETWFKRSFVWRYVVLDEGHMIKNDESMLSKTLQGVSSEYRLMLTGTPIQNNLGELWALLHWLFPEVFVKSTKELFTSSFDLSRGKASTVVMDDARRLLELIMLRRMKGSAGVNLGLPPKTEILLYIPLTPLQRFWYTRLLTRVDRGTLEELFQGIKGKEADAMKQEKLEEQGWEKKTIEELDELARSNEMRDMSGWEESKKILLQTIEAENNDTSSKSAWQKLMNLLMQLRKCCNHPYLLPNAEPEESVSGDHFVQASGKFIVLDKLVQELVMRQKKKILIFSGFTKMLDCCEDYLSMRTGEGAFKFCRIDGGTNRARRNLNIRLFNDQSSDYRVMLISTRAGGLGLNLASATEVVMLDQDWNPQVTLQAEARAHRIGQKNPVTVYKLCTQGTVEEQMLGRIQKKLYLSAKVTEAMRDIHTPSNKKAKRGPEKTSQDDLPQLGTNELKSLMRRGAQTLTRDEIDVNEMVNWDWNTMLEKCKDKPASALTDEAEEKNIDEEQRWLSEMEKVETRIFDGKKYNREATNKTNSEIRQEWSREERRVGKNTTVMVDGYAVNKESMRCGDWEAVPTFAGKDDRLAEPKRAKRRKIEHQEHCQSCWEGGNLICCTGCPRAYHYTCMDKGSQSRTKTRLSSFYCSQHECRKCSAKTTNAGGMMYRCRWCPAGYCEDCVDWAWTDLLGESLDEYETIGFPSIEQAFYIRCVDCRDLHGKDASTRAFFEEKAEEFKERLEGVLKAEEEEQQQRRLATQQLPFARSSSDVTTPEDSELCTPAGEVEAHELPRPDGSAKIDPGLGPERRHSVDMIDGTPPIVASGRPLGFGASRFWLGARP